MAYCVISRAQPPMAPVSDLQTACSRCNKHDPSLLVDSFTTLYYHVFGNGWAKMGRTGDGYSMRFVRDWLAKTRAQPLVPEERCYLESSWKRYAFVLKRVEECIDAVGKTNPHEVTLLDVGPHFFTALLSKRFPELILNTLGYENHRLCPPSIINKHFEFDLNDAQFTEGRSEFGRHDIIVASEVIEHLYTAPSLVLRFLGSLLAPGGRLIVSTPNAVAISKRIVLALGRHPYEMLRESRENPGHIREYTKDELIEAGHQSGLQAEKVYLANYFMHQAPLARACYMLTGFIPSLRDGLTMVFVKG